jgi:hypothetical protein
MKETIEEATEKYLKTVKGLNYRNLYDLSNQQELAFKDGANWQLERMYSDMEEYATFCIECDRNGLSPLQAKGYFEQLRQYK